MKTLVCARPGTLEYTETERPALIPGHTVVRIRRIGICGTDLHAFEGTQPFFSYPRVLGHELSGEVVDTDGASGIGTGEAVSIIPYFHCGTCTACRSGKPNCCVHMKVCGVHVDGGMSEYLSVPTAALITAEGCSLDELALLEPLAIGAHGISRGHVKPGEHVLVVGAGPIGMAAMVFARIAGAEVIALDINADRLRFCRQRLGVRHTVDAASPDVIAALKDLTRGDMPAVVVDATGNQHAIQQAFRCMAHAGRYILIGLQTGDICFSHPEFHKREGALLSSRNALRSDFEHVLASIRNGDVRPLEFITHRVPFTSVKERFKSWLDPASGVVKVVVDA